MTNWESLRYVGERYNSNLKAIIKTVKDADFFVYQMLNIYRCLKVIHMKHLKLLWNKMKEQNLHISDVWVFLS